MRSADEVSRKRAKSGRKEKTEKKNKIEKPLFQPWGSYAEEIIPCSSLGAGQISRERSSDCALTFDLPENRTRISKERSRMVRDTSERNEDAFYRKRIHEFRSSVHMRRWQESATASFSGVHRSGESEAHMTNNHRHHT